jgi:hypothetical protein
MSGTLLILAFSWEMGSETTSCVCIAVGLIFTDAEGRYT